MELATAPLMQQAENERSQRKERCMKALRTTTVTWRLEDITETRAKSKENRNKFDSYVRPLTLNSPQQAVSKMFWLTG